ncbi:hypothetical protein ACFQ0K_10685 [Nocardioides caeni]|uniref:hypothetical protein n=1 Tax=Nocardioides caeni TaxID=574700 RepID=UPI0031EF14A4
MTTLISRAGTVLGASLLAVSLVACGAEDGGMQRMPSTGAAGSGAATSEPEPDEHAAVEPCSLLSDDERAEIIGRPEISYVSQGLAPSDTHLFECALIEPEESLALIRFGYATVPDPGFEESVDYDVETGARLTELEKVGDRALVVRDSYQLDAWATLGDYTVFISSSWHEADDDTLTALLQSMLDKTVPGMLEHPVLLPEACPSPTSQRIVTAVGTVQRAAGSADERHLQCQYASARKTLHLGSYPSTRDYIRLKTGPNDPYAGLASEDRERLVYQRGAVTMLTSSDVGPYSFTYLERPPQVITANLSSTYRFRTSPGYPHFDMPAFRSLDRWWALAQIARLRA